VQYVRNKHALHASMTLQVLGWDVREVVAAEAKPHAVTLMHNNGLEAEHIYKDVNSVANGGGLCWRCGTECKVPTFVPDIFVAGYPCQPASQMRNADKKVVRPEAHKGHTVARTVADCIRLYRPTLVVLENTHGVIQAGTYDGIEQSGLQWMISKLSDMYWITSLDLDLDTWVSISRPRIYMLMIRRDMAESAKLLRTAEDLAKSWERHRRQSPNLPLSRFLIQPADPEWFTFVADSLITPQPAVSAAPQAKRWKADRPIWEIDVAATREKWARQCVPGHSADPMRDAEVAGVTEEQRPKVRAIGNLFLINAASIEGKNIEDLASIKELKTGLFMDISQSWAFQPKGRTYDLRRLKCLVIGSKVYSFEFDRLVSPAELLRAHGWDCDTAAGMQPLNLNDISVQQAGNLLGESMAMQSCVVAIGSLMSAAAVAMKDVWPDAIQQ
jgi:site-specific DNA-cytosine methylase